MDITYCKFVTTYCQSNSWLWEPQSPQIPYMNILDLAVFPCMSKRYSHLNRLLHGTRVLKEQEIWSTALQVWKKSPSCKIANVFIQAKRIRERIIECNGENDF